jgi:Protein of unknown function (DUF3313)
MLQVLVAVILGLSIMLSGCAEALKASPSTGAGFVPVEQMGPKADLPFQKVWFKENVDFKRYKSIYIAPVHTNFLLQSNWWQQNFRQGQMQEDLATMAQYMRDEFKTAFANDPSRHYQVVEAPQPDTLTLELALTELVPSNVALSILEYAPYGGGAAVKVMEKVTGAESTVAFEARMKDSATGDTLAMFADRQVKKIRIIDLKAFAFYAHDRLIIREWAEQFVKLANQRPGEVIGGASPFTLSPW